MIGQTIWLQFFPHVFNHSVKMNHHEPKAISRLIDALIESFIFATQISLGKFEFAIFTQKVRKHKKDLLVMSCRTGKNTIIKEKSKHTFCYIQRYRFTFLCWNK